MLLVVLGVAVALAIEILISQKILLPGLVTGTRQAYSQTAHPAVNHLFAAIADQSGELTADLYVAKTTSLYHMWERTAAALAFVPAMIISASILFPVFKKIRPPGLLAALALAGGALGLATSIRLVGPLAGLLVSVAAIIKTRKGALFPLFLYWIVAALVAYIFWPYLWGAPASRLWESYQVMSNFEWEFPVLFRGVLYAGNDLPRYFIPYIFSIQITLPALIAAGLGVGLAMREALWDRNLKAERIIAAAWILIPMLVAVFFLPAFYDNGRQFLFALPPLFLFGSLAVAAIWRRVHSPLVQSLVALLFLIPGVLGLIRLHPYQYIFYNSLVGGVSGAYRRYELDYMATALEEGLRVVNEIAAPDAVVFVNGPWDYMWPAARLDLQIYDPPENVYDPEIPDYLILTTRANSDQPFLRMAEVEEVIQIVDMPLSVVMYTEAAD